MFYVVKGAHSLLVIHVDCPLSLLVLYCQGALFLFGLFSCYIHISLVLWASAVLFFKYQVTISKKKKNIPLHRLWLV